MAKSSTYLTQDGENVFDLAVKLFGRADTLQTLLTQFTDLNNPIPFNSEIVYVKIDADTTNAKSTQVARTSTKVYKTRHLQSVYDLAVQLYGDVSKIGILLELFPNLDNNIVLNSAISLDAQIDPIALYFSDNDLIVSTDFIRDVIGLRITDLGFRIIHTGDFREVTIA